ncbi:MAG TPA: asparagine synthase (glutamine-hydrolyzing) [Candidatus Polarisedimenticolaceae bacterium]|nr:asparagine synthase (glutamine-hydrolyzing) [Candidatus Polarisedimenticolaceae bacterium]
MCGICGVFNYRTRRPADPRLLQSMTDAMVHRGPDDDGLFIDGDAGLGMRRLSIIDLAGGRQPISNEDGTIHIVVNGEIYNFRELRNELEANGHVFKTRSDSEIPLHAYEEWGLECLARLNGMFGLAIWDSRSRRLVVARDPFGIKPLYVRDTGSELSFASEIRAILADPSVERSVDPEGLELFFTFRFVPSPWTAFRGIKKLRPGHAMVVEDGKVRVHRFHRTRRIDLSAVRTDEIVEELAARLTAAVDRQRVADVPVGVLLSGGVDSTALVTIMRHVLGRAPQTFTVGFDGAFDRDERAAAHATAARLGAEHHDVVLSATDYAGALARSARLLEEPIATSSTLPLMEVCRLAREHVKVVLTGQGADEPFAGYPRHFGERWGGLVRSIPSLLRSTVLLPLVDRLPRNERLKRAVHGLAESSAAARLRAVYSTLNGEARARLLKDGGRGERAAEEAVGYWQADVADQDGLAQMLYVDARFSLPDNLLMYTDKMSMAVSLEARVPFLDLDLMSYAESIPTRLKIRGRSGKWVLKRAMARWLPPAYASRPKIAFETPLSEWLRGGQLADVEERLSSSGSACSEFARPEEIRSLFTLHRNGRRDLHWQLFTLISFEMWHEAFIGGSRPGPCGASTLREESRST